MASYRRLMGKVFIMVFDDCLYASLGKLVVHSFGVPFEGAFV